MAEKQKRQLVFLLGVALWVTWEFSEERQNSLLEKN